MSEAKHNKSYIPPSDLETLLKLPVRDYTFYRFAWFIDIDHAVAFATVINVAIKPHNHKEDFLHRVLNMLGMKINLPAEYFIDPETVGIVENFLVTMKGGFDKPLAVDVYVKTVQDTHRVYKFVFVPAMFNVKAQMRLDIYESSSSNVTLPGSGTRDIHLLFKNASTYLSEELIASKATVDLKPDLLSTVVYFDESDAPTVSRSYWLNNEVIFESTEVLPEDRFEVLNKCKRHHR